MSFSEKTRCFSSTSTLGEILGAEIQEESANDMVNEEFMEVKGNIEKKFTVSEEEGSGVVTLKSSRRGEDICITFDCQVIYLLKHRMYERNLSFCLRMKLKINKKILTQKILTRMMKNKRIT